MRGWGKEWTSYGRPWAMMEGWRPPRRRWRQTWQLTCPWQWRWQRRTTSTYNKDKSTQGAMQRWRWQWSWPHRSAQVSKGLGAHKDSAMAKPRTTKITWKATSNQGGYGRSKCEDNHDHDRGMPLSKGERAVWRPRSTTATMNTDNRSALVSKGLGVTNKRNNNTNAKEYWIGTCEHQQMRNSKSGNTNTTTIDPNMWERGKGGRKDIATKVSSMSIGSAQTIINWQVRMPTWPQQLQQASSTNILAKMTTKVSRAATRPNTNRRIVWTTTSANEHQKEDGKDNEKQAS